MVDILAGRRPCGLPGSENATEGYETVTISVFELFRIGIGPWAMMQTMLDALGEALACE